MEELALNVCAEAFVLSSWIVVMGIFGGGVLTANIIYRWRRI